MTRKQSQKYFTKAEILHQQEKLAEAELFYRRAIVFDPEHELARNGLGVILYNQQRNEEADATFRHALLNNPKQVSNLTNRALILSDQEQIELAEQFANKALTLDPRNIDAITVLAHIRMKQGDLASAESAYNAALSIDKTNATVTFNKSVLDLLKGHLETGWKGYESRWVSILKKSRPTFPKPLWDGKNSVGKTLLIASEQGLGDSIQFVRYASLIAPQFKEVIVGVPQPLVRLFRGISGIRVCAEKPDDVEYDVYCPMLSLASKFTTDLASIPSSSNYLHAPETARNRWVDWFDRKLRNLKPTKKIGLVWAGNSLHANDANRSIQLEQLSPLWSDGDICWINLQRERLPDDFGELTANANWLNPMPEVEDFADTAAIIEQLDLVICVDTSIAHLAGALGKPVWVLLAHPCDWRWTLTHQDSSPWYPSMRLFRQSTSKDWSEPIAAVKKALGDFFAGIPFTPAPPSAPLIFEIVKFSPPAPNFPKPAFSAEYARWKKEVIKHPFWYHRIELMDGLETPGWAPLDLKPYDLPEKLDGLRVLDVGARDGFWTFEALKRGATEVVAIDDFSDTMGLPQEYAAKPWATFDLCRQALGFDDSRCKRMTMSVYDVSQDGLGKFDLVLFFGVLHQLRHPMLALERLASVCSDTLLVESAILDDFSPTRGGMGRGYPNNEMVMEFYPGAEYANNAANCWVPTLRTLAMMVNSVGFIEVDGWKQEETPRRMSQCRGHVKGSWSRK